MWPFCSFLGIAFIGVFLWVWLFFLLLILFLGILFVIMNSFIHTIMYYYYFRKEINHKYNPWWAILLTLAQISQMVHCILLITNSFWVLCLMACGPTSGSRVTRVTVWILGPWWLHVLACTAPTCICSVPSFTSDTFPRKKSRMNKI